MSLSVIALISGGKDSLFSILHCQAHGHTVVALANLYPAQLTNNDEDINSYMYQTVGHSVIPLYEQALGIPLYRQKITGNAVNSSRDYEKLANKEQDETEDLVPLLTRIMQAHPEANAISTGAILSTYQRTRVESVALRLGLTPLSYLWQYPLLPPYTQSSLLHDMAAVGQKSVIIKTASGGLDESFLGLDVAAQRTIAKVSKAMSRFGEAGNGAIVGEGGEFETLALDGPRQLWKKKISLDEWDAEVLDGGQAVLKVKKSSLQEKSAGDDGEGGPLRVPDLFDAEFKSIFEAARDGNENTSATSPDATQSGGLDGPQMASADATSLDHLYNTYNNTPNVFTYTNLATTARTSSNTSPSRQLSQILLRLDHALEQLQLAKSQINHCTLLLRNMADFTVLNPVYAQYFSDINPPARVTIAIGDTMPQGLEVMLSVILDKPTQSSEGTVTRSTNRQGLHVQGRSYWAPANIGPYSQAISTRLPTLPSNHSDEDKSGSEVVYVAGQIPLVPATMDVYASEGIRGQAVLSLQHLWRIGRAKQVTWWTAAVAFIPACSAPESHVREAQAAWKAIHSPKSPELDDENSDEDIDPWDRMNTSTGPSFNDTTHRAPISDLSSLTSNHTPPIPPCFVAQVESLPRGVNIEWSATGLASTGITFSRDAEGLRTRSCVDGSAVRFETVEIGDGEVVRGLGEWTCATLYVGRGFRQGEMMGLKGVHVIPCKRVWGEDGREVKGVIVGRVDGNGET